VVIEVVDNGVGIPADRLAGVMDHGIGLRNVNERLRVIYGASCQLRLHSVAGVGTSVRLEVPDMAAPERISA
jgi:two-component system sensor histidine kinase YesM